MIKGIALQYKQNYPENYKEYRMCCASNEVIPGKMFVYEYTGDLFNNTKPSFIINFPTKKHWRSKSKEALVKHWSPEKVKKFKIEHVKLAVKNLTDFNLLN